MGEKYINPYKPIEEKTIEDIKQKAEKAGKLFTCRFESDSVTFPQWIEMLTNYIIELQESARKAKDNLAEFNKDKEIQYWKDLYESARLENRYGFPISKEDHDKIEEWQRKHDAEAHGLRMAHERVAAGGALGGRYFYKFTPTSIGVFGSCVCGKCHQLAITEAEGENAKYREEMEKLSGSFCFQDL